MVNAAVTSTSLSRRPRGAGARARLCRRAVSPRRRTIRCARGGCDEWLAEGMHGEMDWMEARADVRRGRKALWPEARSVIALGMSYAPGDRSAGAAEGDPERARISVYAQGQRLSRHGQEGAEGAGPLAGAEAAGAAGKRERQGLRRHRAGDGKAARRRPPGSAGRASTPTSSAASTARGCSSARSTPRCRFAPDAPARGPLRILPRLPGRLPDRRLPRALPARCAALHFLPDDRAQGTDPGGIPRGDRQPHLRLRRLPRGLPVEQVRRKRRAPSARSCRAPNWSRRGSPTCWRSTTPVSASCSPARRSSAIGRRPLRAQLPDRGGQQRRCRAGRRRCGALLGDPDPVVAEAATGRWSPILPRTGSGLRAGP